MKMKSDFFRWSSASQSQWDWTWRDLRFARINATLLQEGWTTGQTLSTASKIRWLLVTLDLCVILPIKQKKGSSESDSSTSLTRWNLAFQIIGWCLDSPFASKWFRSGNGCLKWHLGLHQKGFFDEMPTYDLWTYILQLNSVNRRENIDTQWHWVSMV